MIPLMQKTIKQKVLQLACKQSDMVPQTFFDVFPMELKTCTGKLLAAATVHFLRKSYSYILVTSKDFLVGTTRSR